MKREEQREEETMDYQPPPSPLPTLEIAMPVDGSLRRGPVEEEIPAASLGNTVLLIGALQI